MTERVAAIQVWDDAAHVGQEVGCEQKIKHHILFYAVCIWLLSGCGCRLIMSKYSDWQNLGWSVLRFCLRAVGALPRTIHVCCSTTVSNFREQKSLIVFFFFFVCSFLILFLLFVCLDLHCWVVLVFIAKTTCSMRCRNQKNHYLFYSLS